MEKKSGWGFSGRAEIQQQHAHEKNETNDQQTIYMLMLDQVRLTWLVCSIQIDSKQEGKINIRDGNS